MLGLGDFDVANAREDVADGCDERGALTVIEFIEESRQIVAFFIEKRLK